MFVVHKNSGYYQSGLRTYDLDPSADINSYFVIAGCQNPTQIQSSIQMCLVVISRIDYGNALLNDINRSLTANLQRV